MTTRQNRLAAPPETVDDAPQIERLMTRSLVAVTPETGIVIATRLMSASGVRHLPVFEGPRCVGLMLETDALHGLRLCAESAAGERLLTVGDLCRPAPMVRPAERRSDAARQMHAAGIDAALVTDGSQVLGIVTATDLIRSLAHDAPPPP